MQCSGGIRAPLQYCRITARFWMTLFAAGRLRHSPEARNSLQREAGPEFGAWVVSPRSRGPSCIRSDRTDRLCPHRDG